LGWDEEKPRKVVSVLTFTFRILNIVIINRFIFLKGVRVTLFPPPPKPPQCDFKQWIDDYMTPKDIEYVMWIKKNKAAMRKGASSSKLSYVLYLVAKMLFHSPKACQV
jgi:hypothetical protein